MDTQQLITNAIAYIRSAYADPLTIADVADRAGFSTDYFNRLFRAATGFTVMEYVRFTRLSRAAALLRTTSRDVTDIAFSCGYETHESFTRAFGNLYGRSPSDYRAYHENLPMTYADVADRLAAVRFLHDHPDFSPVDNAVVVEELLRRDAIRHGICAVVMYDYNGTQFVKNDTNSCIGMDTFGGDVYADILSDDPATVAEHVRRLRGFAEGMSFSLPGDPADVLETMKHHGIDAEVSTCEWLYRGDVLPCDDRYTVRRLTSDDIPLVKAFAAEYGHDWKVCESLTQRDVYRNAPYDQPLGIFDGDTMAAIFRTGIYEKFGFRLGEVEAAIVLERYKTPEFLRNNYLLAVNHHVTHGYLPFCSTSGDKNEFDPAENGFDLVKIMYSAK